MDETSNLGRYLVMFMDSETPAFLCFAESWDHAKEQAENAYPDTSVYSIFYCDLVWHVNSGPESKG